MPLTPEQIAELDAEFGYNPQSGQVNDAPSFMQRVGTLAAKRREQGEKILANPEISDPSKALQVYGNVGGGFLSDLAGETVSTLTPDFVPEALKTVYQTVTPQGVQDYIGQSAQSAGQGWQNFEQRRPELAGNLSAIGNLANIGLAANPLVKGAQTAVGGATTAVKAAGKAAVNLPIAATVKTAKVAENLAEKAGQGLSKKYIYADLPKEFRNLPEPEALMLQTLRREGVSPEQAVKDYSLARRLGVTPSIAQTSSIPSMATQSSLMARGSQGSKVAADALADIRKVQAPKLNQEIIKELSGSYKDAEQYGNAAAKMAKDAIDAQAQKLKTRAKPYYSASVGVDKSVPVDAIKPVLANPMAVKAMEAWRTDPATLTNVKNQLTDLGVDAADLEKLPYNSTVALHAARVHLREMSDKAFRSGDTGTATAAKSAMNEIDAAIESQFPQYKMARALYSEDIGALKTLKDSPLGKMASMNGNVSEIADDLMKRDPQDVSKFLARIKSAGVDETKMREALAGAYAKSRLQGLRRTATNAGEEQSFNLGKAIIPDGDARRRLVALVGEAKVKRIEEINGLLDNMAATERMATGQSITSAANALREETATLPTGGILSAVADKFTPSLTEMVRSNPEFAARYNELLFTDKGIKFLETIAKKPTLEQINSVSNYLRNPPLKDLGVIKEIPTIRVNPIKK